MDIGHKIKELRISKNLTLEELASRCELTKGFLSQLERNLTSPSIATLDDILEALGSNLSDFFQEDKQDRIVFRKEDYYINEKDGATIYWIVPDAQKRAMEPLILTLEKDAQSQVIMPHDGEEFGYVLAGEVVLKQRNNEYPIKAGETFYLNGKHKHILMNKKEKLAKIMWVMTPPNF
ncbi:MAG: helix-turn-helix domain-containing protein [Erysipelotrichia bacterium]|nr:helix-turn-helix domain-containing protein [Erysipelotrichia bacterium]NCC55267.1 helix-turn-helix domain-containing protein [Erysipelotrichia bacterium]